MCIRDRDFDDIHVVVQPKSVIHSMIQFKDGSVIAQLGTPDMKLPIQYALFYPQHRKMCIRDRCRTARRSIASDR